MPRSGESQYGTGNSGGTKNLRLDRHTHPCLVPFVSEISDQAGFEDRLFPSVLAATPSQQGTHLYRALADALRQCGNHECNADCLRARVHQRHLPLSRIPSLVLSQEAILKTGLTPIWHSTTWFMCRPTSGLKGSCQLRVRAKTKGIASGGYHESRRVGRLFSRLHDYLCNTMYKLDLLWAAFTEQGIHAFLNVSGILFSLQH